MLNHFQGVLCAVPLNVIQCLGSNLRPKILFFSFGNHSKICYDTKRDN